MNGQLALLRLVQNAHQQGDVADLYTVLNGLQQAPHTSPALSLDDDRDSASERMMVGGPRLDGFPGAGFSSSDTYSHVDSCPSPHSPFSPLSPPLSCVSNPLSSELDLASPTKLRNAEAGVPVYYDYARGRCARSDCKYLHATQKVEKTRTAKRGICFDYLRGDCNRGVQCRFSHDVSSFAQEYKVDEDVSLAKVKRWGQGICFDFVRGACSRGDACPWSHNLLEIAVATKRGIESMETSERNRIAETVRCRLTASMEARSEHEQPHEMNSLPAPCVKCSTTRTSDWIALWDYPANVFGPLDDLGRPLHWFADANVHLMQI